MNLWKKIKQQLQIFMQGRYGSDELTKISLWTGLILYLIDMFIGQGILSTLGFAVYAYTIFRMFSRNIEKRADENRKYLAFRSRFSLKYNQTKTRFEKRKEYKYIKCPQCHTLMRLPRKAGKVTVTCKQCGNKFDTRS